MNKVTKTIWIREDQQEAIRALSAKTRVPAAVYYREAIDLVLERYAKVLQKEDRDD